MQTLCTPKFTYTEYNQPFVNAGTVWSFWDGNPPKLVLRCFETMRMNNPARPIVILNKLTLSLFLSCDDYPLFEGNLGCHEDFPFPQYLADWVRITLLEKYGGVWFDASVICTNPVETWASSSNDENTSSKIAMFPMHANPNIHGNWSMAADRAGHPLLCAWREELSSIFNESGTSIPTEYIHRAFAQHPQLVDLWHNPSPPPLPYLWVYLALQVVLQKQPNLHGTINLIPNISGPMHRRFQYNVVQGVSDDDELSQKTANDLALYPLDREGHDRYFIKLVGKDRQPTQHHMDDKRYALGSALDELSRIPARPIVYGKDLHRLVVPIRRNALLLSCSRFQADMLEFSLQQTEFEIGIPSSREFHLARCDSVFAS